MKIHNKAGLAGTLEIPTESFTRAVEIVLKESTLQDAPAYRPSADLWTQAVRSSSYVQTRVASAGIGRLHHALKVPLNIVRASFLPDALQRICSPYFRYCRKCLNRGYHGVAHQLESLGRCPIHGGLLKVACRSCGSRAPNRLNAYLLDAPYRCGNCGRLYSSFVPSLLSKRRLSKKARIVITRLRLSLYTYF